MENGGDAPAEVDAADVSAVGTLVWVRRNNGSWWPGRVLSPNDVPDCCPAPPRSPATPILLLGRRDGPVFVEWLNLDRSKRVKPFRCGERGLEDCIRTAEEQAADRRLRPKTGAGGGTRYARKDDAVLQALEIERASLRSSSSRPTTTTNTKPSHSAPAPAATASGRKRRRTPNDSEDDAPQRMKDLTDIGKHATPNAPAFTDLNQHLPSTSQMKRTKQSHHDSAKRNQPAPTADQVHPCGISRRRDRSRPLSELCNGDAWNGHRPNGQRPHQHLMHAASSLGMVLDNKPSSRRAVGPVIKTELGYGDMWKNGLKPNGQRADQRPIRAASSLDAVLDTRSNSRHAIGPVKTEPVDDGFPLPVNVRLAATSIMKTDHLHVHQPCASTKAPTQEHTNQASNCSKDGISSQCDSRNSKKKTITSVDHECINKTKTVPEREHRRERAAKHRAPSNEVILLEKRVEKSAAADKTVAPADDYKGLAVITPNGLDCVGAVLQQHSGIKCKVEEPAETTSNHSNRENVPEPSVVFELPPHQVLLPQQRDLVAAGCHAVKPVKTLQLNSSIYDVEISAQGGSSGSSKGGRVPLVSLMSKSSQRPVVGYPVTVEVLDDTAPRPPAPSVHDYHHPSTSNTVNRPMKVEEEEAVAPAPQRAMPLPSSHRAARTTRAKAKSRRKASDDDESWRPHTKNSPVASSSANLKSRRKTTEDETWRPHTKNPVSSSPRKMRRLSSFGPSQRGAGGGDRRPAAVGPFAVACIPLRLVFSRIHEALS